MPGDRETAPAAGPTLVGSGSQRVGSSLSWLQLNFVFLFSAGSRRFRELVLLLWLPPLTLPPLPPLTLPPLTPPPLSPPPL